MQKQAAETSACNRHLLAFEVTLFAFVISIDVFPYPDAPSSFLPLLYIAFPALFILRFRQMFTIMFLVEIVYARCSYTDQKSADGRK